VSGHVKTQLIAHDKEVYDIAFSRAGGGRDMFASVGKILCAIHLCCVWVIMFWRKPDYLEKTTSANKIVFLFFITVNSFYSLNTKFHGKKMMEISIQRIK
jgi:hypothetical protein